MKIEKCRLWFLGLVRFLQRTFSGVCILLLLSSAAGAQPSGSKNLQARTITLAAQKITLADALEELHKATGNAVNDRRAQRTNPALKLNLKEATFWEALDEIARQAGCGYSPYQAEAAIALVDVARAETQVFYQGIFRVAVKRVAITRDQESGMHFGTLTLEAAWEPRFQPFYLDVGPAEITFAADGDGKMRSAKTLERGQVNVTGRHAAEFELRFAAPPRSVPAIASLKGNFSLTGPSKMLTFRFDELEAKAKYARSEDGVKLELVTPSSVKANPWRFGVLIQNPPGPAFESFQFGDWLAYNEIKLVKKGQAPRTAEDFAILESPPPSFARTAIEYAFTQNLPVDLSGWSLVYRTAGRIVEMPVAYQLKNISLP